jgi:hypothetical protein
MDERDDDLAAEARKQIKDWESGHGAWVEEAREAYAMLHGDQWTETDMEIMRDAKRPLVTMNRIAALIRAVCGLEVSQRQEVRYIAPELGDVQSTELQNAAAKWAREQCDAEDEESDAFRDMLTCGLGWTETRVDFDVDPEGQLVVERIDPLDMRWDAMSTKKGLADSRWRARLKRMHISEVKAQWPDKADEITAYVEDTDGLALITHHNTSGDGYNGSGGSRPESKDEVTVLQYQYWEKIKYAKVTAPDGKLVDLPVDRLAKLQDAGFQYIEVNRFERREYRQAILCGPLTLEDEKLNASSFTLVPLTGTRDRNKGTWYGLVRDMIEPQRFSNKFFSSMIDIVATNAKGGVMAETTAVEDPRKFEEQWNNPRATIWMKPGGLGKVAPREAPNMPPAIPQMMEFAVQALPQVSGINYEFLGTTNREQSGVLEYHRKQAVSNSLAEFFASLRQYRKNQGKVMLELIYTFLADGRLVRVVGKQGEQFLPLYKQADVKYDVVVDEAPSAPDRKMQTWMALQELLPMALKAGLPIPPEVLDYTPLPATLSQEWKQLMTQRAGGPSPEQLQQMQKQMQQLQQENQQLKARNEAAMASVQVKAQESQARTAITAAESQAEMQRRAQEQQFDQMMAMREFMAEMQQTRQEMALARAELAGNLSIKRAQARAATTDKGDSE